MMAMMLAKMKGLIDEEKYREVLRGLITMPDNIKEVLDQHEHIQSVASIFTYARNFLYLGRGCNYPTAMGGTETEGDFLHPCGGVPAAEMKHGTIALIDQEMPTIVIATNGSVYEKTISNIQEIKARGGKVIVVVTEGDCIVAEMADYCIWIPKTAECLTPLLSSIPLQLFAYYIAVNKGAQRRPAAQPGQIRDGRVTTAADNRKNRLWKQPEKKRYSLNGPSSWRSSGRGRR